jgi:hypothetical protein
MLLIVEKIIEEIMKSLDKLNNQNYKTFTIK